MEVKITLTSLAGEIQEILVDSEETVGHVLQKAKVATGKAVRALICENGVLMRPLSMTIQLFGIVQGSRVTMLYGHRPKIYRAGRAFALVRADGRVVTWGRAVDALGGAWELLEGPGAVLEGL